MKFLIILAYFNRPKIVQNALRSIAELQYDNWKLVIIDDGSTEVISKDTISILTDKRCIDIQYIPDTPYQKIAQGGSRHGEYINNAILNSDADVYIILCDDDALLPDYLTNLNKWFTENTDKKYCYSHVRPFNPSTESPFGIEKRDWWTNRSEPLNPWNMVDSTQVVFRTSCFKEDGLRYPSPQTKDLDAAIFTQAYAKYGLCHYTGFDGQYKGVFEGQLGNREPFDQYFNTNLDK